MKTAYVALGSNIGDRHANITFALSRLNELKSKLSIQETSNVYASSAAEMDEQNTDDFLNVVCRVVTSLSPEELIKLTRSVEEGLGRKTDRNKNKSRTIDIDLLFYESYIIDSKELTIPHPRIYKRDFVFVPLGEVIKPNWKEPLEGLNYTQLSERKYRMQKKGNNLRVVLSLSKRPFGK